MSKSRSVKFKGWRGPTGLDCVVHCPRSGCFLEVGLCIFKRKARLKQTSDGFYHMSVLEMIQRGSKDSKLLLYSLCSWNFSGCVSDDFPFNGSFPNNKLLIKHWQWMVTFIRRKSKVKIPLYTMTTTQTDTIDGLSHSVIDTLSLITVNDRKVRTKWLWLSYINKSNCNLSCFAALWELWWVCTATWWTKMTQYLVLFLSSTLLNFKVIVQYKCTQQF